MRKIIKAAFYAPIVSAFLLAFVRAQGETNECLKRDAQIISGHADWMPWGEFIDDGKKLTEEGWAPGMHVREVNYCMETDSNGVSVFVSLQLIVGDDQGRRLALYKHGGEGGSCRKWVLQEGDYIRRVQYTWNRMIYYVTEVAFQTHLGQTRVIGGVDGSKVNYDFSAFQPFVGFYSYEAEDRIYGFGTYEDDCHLAPSTAKLPFGFGTSNVPSMSEITGSAVVGSATWVNDVHGTAATELEALDQVIRQEIAEDAAIEEPDQDTARIVNQDFTEIAINLEVNSRPVEAAPTTQGAAFEEAVQRSVDEQTARLQGELAEARAELARKDELVSQRLTQERVGENRTLEEEDASESTAWTLFAVVVILLIIMIGVLLCMGLYIRSQKRQRRNAREVEQHSARYAGESSDIEGSEKKASGTAGSRLVAVGALSGPNGFNDPYNVPENSFQQQHAHSTSTVGLVAPPVQAPAPAPTAQTMSLGDATPVGTYATNQTDKLANADPVVEPGDVQLDFAQQQPDTYGAAAAGLGRNPFQTQETQQKAAEDEDDGGDLNLTEDSSRGPQQAPTGQMHAMNASPANPHQRV